MQLMFKQSLSVCALKHKINVRLKVKPAAKVTTVSNKVSGLFKSTTVGVGGHIRF